MPIVWVQTNSNRVFDVVEAAERALSPGQQADPTTPQDNDLTLGDTYLAENLSLLRQAWSVDPWRIVEGSQSNVGRLFGLGQHVVRRLTWWYTLPQVQQITEFQSAVVRTTDSVLEHLRQMRAQIQAIEAIRSEQRLRALEEQLRNARNEQQLLLRRILELEAQVHTLTAQLDEQRVVSQEDEDQRT